MPQSIRNSVKNVKTALLEFFLCKENRKAEKERESVRVEERERGKEGECGSGKK